jgi:hypothetical protein
MRELYALLRDELPQVNRLLIGHDAILLHLRQLGVTQCRGVS